MTTRIQQIWDYRIFLSSIVGKEFKVRYSQSVLGVAWLVVEPLLLVLTLSTIFTLIGRTGPGGAPFPVFFYAGLLPWQIFASALSKGTTCFVSDKSLMHKIPFPKEISVVKALATYYIDFLFACISFVGVLIFFRYAPNLNYLYIPLLLLLIGLLAAGLMFLLGTIHVYIRDIGILAKTLTTVWFWFTPIIFYYPFEGPTEFLYYVNPMAGIIYGFRNIILFNQPPIPIMLISSLVWISVMFIVGYWLFRRHERTFADVI